MLTLAVGCGDDGSGGSHKDEAAKGVKDNCVILQNGNKLCGADAKAYCERFSQDTADAETARACIAVGADLTSAKEDSAIAEEQQQEKAAAADRKLQAAAADFEPAAKKALGEDFLAVTRSADVVTVETFYVQGEAVSDTDRPVPPASKLKKACATIKKTDRTSTIEIVEDGGGTPLVRC